LRYIRETLAASGHLSIVPGRGIALIGVLALAAVAVNLQFTGAPWEASASPQASLLVWVVLLAASVAVGIASMANKARRTAQIFWSPVLRKALWGYAAAMALGALLTASVIRSGRMEMLPEIWLGCYGTALTASGAVSIAAVRWMGISFLLLAAAAAIAPASAGLLLLGLGFGWLHLSFGAYIAWRHNG
jgi:hypothetical protein